MNPHTHHDHAGPGHGHEGLFDSDEVAALIELEGEVLADLLDDALAALSELCRHHGVEVRRVLDLGSGPGVGTCRLAQRFDAAHVTAVDGSEAMLAHAARRVGRLGLEARVDTRLVDLPDGLEDLGRADVVWSSMFLHHLPDEEAALRSIRDLLGGGGLLVLIERSGPLRVLPDEADLGLPGLWDRLDAAWAAWFADMRAGLPGATPSASYPDMLGAAGFEVLADRSLTLVLGAPLDDRARRFAHGQLERTREHLEPYGEAADVEALDLLIDEDAAEGILRRGDGRISATRQLYVARAAG